MPATYLDESLERGQDPLVHDVVRVLVDEWVGSEALPEILLVTPALTDEERVHTIPAEKSSSRRGEKSSQRLLYDA